MGFSCDLRVLARHLPVRLATQRKSLHKFNLPLLASRLTRALQNAHLLKMTGENHAMPGEELPHKKYGVRVGN